MEAADLDLLQKMAASWPKRATVRADLYKYQTEYVDPERSDYPLELIPFAGHPRYLATTPEQKQRIATWGWLVYNERTIQSEEFLANPAFTLIMHGAFPGADDLALRQSVQHCLIDEHFHTLIHMTAIHETRAWRNIEEVLVTPLTITVRNLHRAQAEVTERWQRDCLSLVYGVVAEVSIKAYLNLLAENDDIQPVHKMIALVHNRDEAAHGQLLVPVTKALWENMNETQRRFFIDALPGALSTFVAHDFSAWRAVLEHERVTGADEIIRDCEHEAVEKKKMVRDVSGLRQLAEELSILDRIDFDFGPAAQE
jgi:4-aminobenzoate N-oxygenase